MPDGPYSISDIQDYFEYIIKKHETLIDNPSIRIYLNKTQNRITLRTKAGCFLELLVSESMKLPWKTENKVNKDKNGENVPYLADFVIPRSMLMFLYIVSSSGDICISKKCGTSCSKRSTVKHKFLSTLLITI